MPDLANLSLSSSLALARCPALKPLSDDSAAESPSADSSAQVLALTTDGDYCDDWDRSSRLEACGNGNGSAIKVVRRSRGSIVRAKKVSCFEEHVMAWIRKKMELGALPSKYYLPFLNGAQKMAECLVCHKTIYPGEELLCTVRGCQGGYHLICAKERLGISNTKKFKCPQHACFICRQKLQWRCVRCEIASHDKCAPWSDKVIHLKDQPGRAICWRHPADWKLDQKHAEATCDIEEVFSRLPLPYVDEEFKIDFTWKDLVGNKLEPPPYVHIKRNIYLVKKKRDNSDDGIGCTSCRSECCEDCVCRVQSISCSKACHCSENCTNRPFRKEKKIKLVKTEFCGWGVEAAEPISKGEFIIEYIGEVIDDALCEQRLWDMKYRGVKNFYMCEIRKDFTIDATFKGNTSRFLNHSCDPNCILEKWQVEGETRVGVFATQSIKVGEPLTYDYRFVQFGPEVKCYCGAPSCQGYLGTKRKVSKLNLCWGSKRKRTSTACLAIITL
ncbi:histone-lysine N-methyltransferase ASHR3 [Mangifera indica]|uniref:histone-lysine N-methyltransferase ASHR3 n=1 Tax=Mangifera indica TaxID=29780 RepID=UPI001CFBF601|nr:histone-lysine N-methyltransferase ASHR3 [Mangifera indica]